MAGFLEDSWKVRSNLTLNLGVRYDLQAIPQPRRPNTRTPLLASVTTRINTDANNVAPRIGLSWEFLKNTVLRAGYGIFYAKTTNSTFYTVRVENGVFQQTASVSPPSGNTGCPPAAPCPTFPNVLFPAPGPPLQAPFPGALTPQVQTVSVSSSAFLSRGLSRDFENPLVHEGELGLERQLPGRMSVSATYLFSRGLRLPVFVDVNLARATQTKTYDVTDAAGNTVKTVTVPFYTQRLDPASGRVLTGFSVLNSWYHGLVVTVRKPFSNGVELLANYTFSKSIDNGEVLGTNGTFNGTDTPLDPFNQKAEHSLSDLDQRHRFVGSVYWAPKLKNVQNGVARCLLNDWGFSSIVTIASPRPLTGMVSGAPFGGADFGVTEGEVSSFGGFTGGRIPQVGRNTFHDHTQFRDVDFRVTREFPIYERFKLQIIGEAFNLFNHTNITESENTAFDFTRASSCGTPGSHVNDCLVPDGMFLNNNAAGNSLYGARQLQFSAKITF